MLGLAAVLVEHRLVTDGQTHDDSKYRDSIASREKNTERNPKFRV